MSWRDRRAVLAGLAASGLVAACRVEPAFGPQAPARKLVGQVHVAPIGGGREGLWTRQAIERRLGSAGEDAPYRLTVALSFTVESMGVSLVNAATRNRYLGTATFTLTDATGRVLASGTEENIASYDATGTTQANAAAGDDALRRLSEALGDQIATRLILSAGDWAA
ncbi:MAG: hypothetical protein D6811_06245 [Alphaproteobacteria bacterium]|nr:MAG: hypothetical protein D6811_06245 [Alphaproteobacteria bacterium]